MQKIVNRFLSITMHKSQVKDTMNTIVTITLTQCMIVVCICAISDDNQHSISYLLTFLVLGTFKIFQFIEIFNQFLLIIVTLNWVVVIHTFNLNTHEAEAERSLSLKPAWSVIASSRTTKAMKRNPVSRSIDK